MLASSPGSLSFNCRDEVSAKQYLRIGPADIASQAHIFMVVVSVTTITYHGKPAVCTEIKFSLGSKLHSCYNSMLYVMAVLQ